jgi:diguanylate cyclase (GGDEF)-like protein
LAVALRSTRLVEKLGYDATHDSLTGLSNRGYLSRQIDHVLSTAGHEAAVLLLDLDRFKEVNDALGHDVGDRLLTVVGDRLRHSLPTGATVARLGGDEFAVLLPDLPGGPDGVAELAEQVADTLAQPVQFEEATLTPEASIGVAVTSRANPQADLLRQADTAMYEAKANDRRVAVYGPEMDRGRIERLALVADLRQSLSTHPEQFVLHYQPKIDLETGTVPSVEALVRWNHPTLGVVPPDRFIPLAESTGLIRKLTPLVLEVALRECANWSAEGITISVAVNLSAQNISDPGLPQRVARALTDAGVPAERLILEITESSVMGDPEQTMPVLHQLHDLGTCLSLDDFGTGYSSLSYLQRLPVGEVKIDRSFVLGLASDNRDNSRALIRSITGLGATLGLRIVAEGVEDQAALDELRALGCHVAQGYHISRPLAAADLRLWLARESDTRPRLRLLTANS